MASEQVNRVFPADVASAAAARRFAAVTLRFWSLDSLIEPVQLMVNELVANAVGHAGSSAEVRLVLDAGRLHVDVEDKGDQPPIAVSPSDEGGRGLLIVEALSSSWGYAPTPTGKRVWFEVDLDG